ncbi:hypothetical protein QFZ79_002890 [Arthrobacter sp. V4I6]|uniref:DUF7426 family protein n=1 Tax=Arthrobacter sp. V4I6 TaxID=3042281 RepID=UPI0027832F22|nr:hypothetical protein [Arthrobacter sp. V4I6]MDQ0854779.1 hypothetical protein [Arthrobacter sp. V4I6]
MTELRELDDFLNPTLLVPANGKEYRIAAVDAATGLRLQKMLTIGVKAHAGTDPSEKDLELVSDEDEESFFQSVLGDTYAELLADKIPYPGLKAIASLAMIWTTQGFDPAQQYFLAGGKAPAPNRAERRTGTRTSTAAATTTPKAASPSGTSTRKSRAKATPGNKS